MGCTQSSIYAVDEDKVYFLNRKIAKSVASKVESSKLQNISPCIWSTPELLNYLKQHHLFDDAVHNRYFVNRTEIFFLEG